MAQITVKNNDIGQYAIIQCKYEDLEVFEYPQSCVHCPFGYMKQDCGCPKDFINLIERPDTCKLKLVDRKSLFE